MTDKKKVLLTRDDMVGEDLFNADEVIDEMIEYYSLKYYYGITKEGLIDFAKKIITISRYEKNTTMFGRTCRTCKHQYGNKKECAGCDAHWSKWQLRYTKEDFGV